MDKPKIMNSPRIQKLFTAISKRLISKHIAENYTKEVAELTQTSYYPVNRPADVETYPGITIIRSQDTEPSEVTIDNK